MSPLLTFLSISSSIAIWVITILGLSPKWFTLRMVPFLVVYCLCDHSKLLEAAARVGRRPMGIALGFCVVALCIACLGFIPWSLFILLGYFFCLVRAFSFEKHMYMGDALAEISKSVCWKVASIFTDESSRMRWKGEWAYCSPYSRNLVCKDTHHYYTLQPGSLDQSVPESYELDFSIEKCRVVCKYTKPEDQSLEREKNSSTVREGTTPVEDIEPHPTNSARSDKGFDDWTFSADNVASPEDESSSQVSKTAVVGEDASSIKNKALSDDFLLELPSQRVQATHITKDDERYVLVRAHVNRLEVSLQFQQETLASYAFYDQEPDAVAEVKRVLQVLEDHGNLVFSSFHTNTGSSAARAHARCYQFEEIFDLILNAHYKLYLVDLPSVFRCYISGNAILQVLGIGVALWSTYYQLQQQASMVNVCFILVLHGVIHVLQVIVDYDEKKVKARRCFHSIIKVVAPNKVENWYRAFQVRCPWLTFSNESYGYPYTSNVREICFFSGTRLCKTGAAEVYDLRLGSGPLQERVWYFDLLALSLSIDVKFHQGAQVKVYITMFRRYDGLKCIYHSVFSATETSAGNLIALIMWLQDHNCIGVCKDWPKINMMHAYSYEELFVKVLKQEERPFVLFWPDPFDICVE